MRQASSPKSASFITFLFFFSTTVIVRRPVLLRSAVREEATGPTRMSGNILYIRAKGSILVVAFAGCFTFDTNVHCFGLILIP